MLKTLNAFLNFTLNLFFVNQEVLKRADFVTNNFGRSNRRIWVVFFFLTNILSKRKVTSDWNSLPHSKWTSGYAHDANTIYQSLIFNKNACQDGRGELSRRHFASLSENVVELQLRLEFRDRAATNEEGWRA